MLDSCVESKNKDAESFKAASKTKLNIQLSG